MADNIRETIEFQDIKGISVGNAQDDRAKTGVTVFYFDTAATAAVSVLGGGPASRETEVLGLERNTCPVNALVFSGGSTFGLEAAHGVIECLEKEDIGIDTGDLHVPIVCQSDIYDLSYGSSSVRPDKAMGYKACLAAMSSNDVRSGCTGAGTGATVGKPKGVAQAQKSGIGYAAARLGGLEVGVAAVVNAYGDIYYKGSKIAGMLSEDRSTFCDAEEALWQMQPSNLFTGNTTLVAVFTNGDFDGRELRKIATMASAGMARAIRPVFTMADGDTIYALSAGSEKVAADVNVAGSLAASVVEEAIRDAVTKSQIPEDEYLANVRH